MPNHFSNNDELSCARLYQRQLRHPLQAFDFHLALRCRRSIPALLREHHFDRHAHPRVFGGRAGVVRREALFEIVGDAAVQRIVRAAQQVAEPAHSRPRPDPSPWPFFRGGA